MFFSGQSFITKLSAGISSIIQGVGYSIVGFSGDNVSACNEALRAGASFKDQFPQYAGMMFFLCSIPPAIGLFLSIIPLRHYGMTDEEHRTIWKRWCSAVMPKQKKPQITDETNKA